MVSETSVKVTFRSSTFSFRYAHNLRLRRAMQALLSKLASYFLAIRPWTFGASVTPILLGTVLAYKYGEYLNLELGQKSGPEAASPPPSNFYSLPVLCLTLVIAVTLHGAGNLVNSYYDYQTGLDSSRGPLARDRTLVDRIIEPEEVVNLAGLLYVAASAGLLCLSHYSPARLEHLALVFFGGMSGSFLYTGGGVGLKYFVGLGDLVVILTFGPVCVAFSFLAQTGAGNGHSKHLPAFDLTSLSELLSTLVLYSMPLFLGTEAALHSNNAVDALATAALIDLQPHPKEGEIKTPLGSNGLGSVASAEDLEPRLECRQGLRRRFNGDDESLRHRDIRILNNTSFSDAIDKTLVSPGCGFKTLLNRSPIAITTFASLIGPIWSVYFYRALVYAPYAIFAYFAVYKGCFWFLLPILTLRKATRLTQRFTAEILGQGGYVPPNGVGQDRLNPGKQSTRYKAQGKPDKGGTLWLDNFHLRGISEKTAKLNFEIGIFYILACYLTPSEALYRW